MQSDVIKRLFGRGGQKPPPLPRQTVEHDSVDDMQFGNFVDDSPRFRKVAVENKPVIVPNIPDPDPIDFTSATPAEIKAWQEEARDVKAKRDAAKPYEPFPDLARDTFYSYHHATEPQVLDPGEVDPAIAHHSKIMQKIICENDHATARNLTRDDKVTAACATMGAMKALKELLGEELVEQARESQEFEEARDAANEAMEELESLRDDARDLAEEGQPIPGELVEQIKQAVIDKRAKQGVAADLAGRVPRPMTQAAHEKLELVAQAGREAAEKAGNIPIITQGYGEGEPRFDSPEQALTIADMWTNDPTLRAIAELYGRFDRHFRFQRARRVEGGADEIVDLKFGDDIRRILPSELAALADEDLEDDFYMRYFGGELRVYETVGEENAGRGPIIMVVDESGSMDGERNVWAKAISICLLSIARREKRDFAYVGFSSGRQVHSFTFEAKDPITHQGIVDMASHFYGGGTTPVIGIAMAEEIMTKSHTRKAFKKADIVMVTDGEATFADEDKRLRNKMVEIGVRFHGIGIGGSYRYLRDLTDDTIDIFDLDLQDPSEATAHLATHIS